MATIPQATDYGARPSLRSNRVDLPGSGDTATGDALARAAGTFATIYGQQKEKKDRLNYSLAKNELLTADIREREKLRDDEDWQTYDERYTTGYNTARDEIYARYSLDPDDSALLDADSDLIRERARVQVADASRVTKIDNETAKIEANLVMAREQVLNADPATANDLMLTQLENIKAGEESGIYTDAQALTLSQKFVQDTAHARLVSMDVKDRIAEIELSLAHRKARGPISIEDIQAEKGSGSIGDFVHKDTLTEMLRKATDEDKHSTMQGDVFSIIDQVVADFPETDSRSLAQRKKAAREMLNRGDPEYGAKRNFLEQELSQRNAEDKAIKDLGVFEIELNLMDQIRGGKSFGELFAGDIALMSPQQQKFVKDFADNWQDNEGFADSTNEDMSYAWYHNFTPTQKANANINGAEWRTQFTRQDWNRMIQEQEAYSNAKGKDPNIYRGDPDDEILKNMLVGGAHSLFAKVPKPGTTEYARYLRIDGQVNRALTDASLAKYVESGSGYLSPQEVQQITAQSIGQVVLIEKWLGRDTRTTLHGLSESEKKGGAVYVDIDEMRNIDAPTDSLGNPQNMEQFIRQFAGANGDDLSDRTIEKAYFLWISGDTAGAEALLTD